MACSKELREGQAAKAAEAPPVPYKLYRADPVAPIFQIIDGAPLPKNAIFHGYIRPQRGGLMYQLFKFPPKVRPEELDDRARAALEAGGFIFNNTEKAK